MTCLTDPRVKSCGLSLEYAEQAGWCAWVALPGGGTEYVRDMPTGSSAWAWLCDAYQRHWGAMN